MVTAGLRLRVAMAVRGWTPYRLAKVTGLSHPTVNRIAWDRGAVYWQNLVAMADALAVPVEWVAEGRNPPSWLGTMVDQGQVQHAAVR